MMKLNEIEEQYLEQQDLEQQDLEQDLKQQEPKKKIHKKIVFMGISILAVVLATVITIISLNSNSTKTVYKETVVTYGDLTVGVTETGAISVGASDQTFDLDISAFVATGQSSDLSGNIWGGENMGGMVSPMGNETTTQDTTTSSSRELEIEEIYISVGQQIEKGTPLLKLTDDSVDSIRTELETDVSSAELTLSKLITSQEISRLTATHTYESNHAYGTIAESDYNETIKQLNLSLAEVNTSLGQAKVDLVGLQEDLTQLQLEYNNALATSNAAELALSQIDKTQDIYNYIVTENIREEAESTKKSLEDELDKLQENIELQESQIVTLESDVAKTQGDIVIKTAIANATYTSRLLASKYASEIYNVSNGYLDLDLLEAQKDYDEAKEKLDTFDEYIIDGTVLSEYNGVITEIAGVVGDTLSSSETILSIYDWDDVTISVDVSEDEMDAVALEETVNITFDAYPDILFNGTITTIDDAQTDSNTTEITYPVTATVQGDVSGLYVGMTGDVTFVTKETKQVIYVSNRAIVRNGTKSYVKVKDDSGDIVEKQVTTGFSDGINVEIIEGLSEGDIVLIESKVSE